MDVLTAKHWCGAWLAAIVLVALVTPASALELNAGKYGSMFYWWFDRLPPATLYPPTIAWDARDPNWWVSIVKQAQDAGLGWLAPDCWGEATNADPATLGPLLAAIDKAAPRLKLAFRPVNRFGAKPQITTVS